MTAKLGRHVTPADLGLATDTDGIDEVGITIPSDPVEASQRTWRDVRQHLIRNRSNLSARAVELYDPFWRMGQAPMLSQDSWLPDTPIPLENLELEWEPNPPNRSSSARNPKPRALLPLHTRSQTFPSYSSAIRYLNPPALFENRPCYRLLDATLNDHPCLRFGQSCFFDKIDVAEALAHEMYSAVMNETPSWPDLPFRSFIADPFDLAPRTAL